MPKNTLYVTGFSRESKAIDLAPDFEKYGDLVRLDIPPPRTPESKKFAFVEYKNSEDCEKALELNGKSLPYSLEDGLVVELAKSDPLEKKRKRMRSRGPPPPHRYNYDYGYSRGRPPMNSRRHPHYDNGYDNGQYGGYRGRDSRDVRSRDYERDRYDYPARDNGYYRRDNRHDDNSNIGRGRANDDDYARGSYGRGRYSRSPSRSPVRRNASRSRSPPPRRDISRSRSPIRRERSRSRSRSREPN